MKKITYRTLITFVLASALAACGGSEGGGGGDNGAPALSNLRIPPVVYRGNTYAYTVDYSDPDGDITMLYYTELYYSDGQWRTGRDTYSYTAGEAGISGTSGTATFNFTILQTTDTGNYQAKVWAEDAAGHTSDRATAAFEVR